MRSAWAPPRSATSSPRRPFPSPGPRYGRIEVSGTLAAGVSAKDLIIRIIADLGVNGGIGFAYEYAGPAIAALPMEARLTLCNMSIEAGARAGYVNPGRDHLLLPARPEVRAAGGGLRQGAGATGRASPPTRTRSYDDVFRLDGSSIEPMVAWGINPGQAVGVTRPACRSVSDARPEDQEALRKAYEHTGFEESRPLQGLPVDVAFVGSCTNGRISDLREAARVVKGQKVSSRVKALAVPGSKSVARQAESEGLDEVFRAAGFEWREAGCSMCLAMNPDKLTDRQVCASSSNRNFIGRQGSPKGTHAAHEPGHGGRGGLAGEVVDARTVGAV